MLFAFDSELSASQESRSSKAMRLHQKSKEKRQYTQGIQLCHLFRILLFPTFIMPHFYNKQLYGKFYNVYFNIIMAREENVLFFIFFHEKTINGTIIIWFNSFRIKLPFSQLVYYKIKRNMPNSAFNLYPLLCFYEKHFLIQFLYFFIYI